MHLKTIMRLTLADTRIVISILFLLVVAIVKCSASATTISNRVVVHQDATVYNNGSTISSPWLEKGKDPRAPGCWNRPWICNRGKFPPRTRRMCCRNKCIDVTSDVNNCGLCGIRCRFTWQCCRGICVDINNNRFHCGKCKNRCPFGSLCAYGMCGYAWPLPPFPFPPRPPHPPHPPHPPKPPRPPPCPLHPPHPPHPPHGPHPWPPRDQPPPPFMG